MLINPKYNCLKDRLKSQIGKHADQKRKLWFENYIKHNTKYRGVELPTIRNELKEWYKEENIVQLSLNEQLDMALSFFEEDYTEDKFSGILFLQLYLYKKIDYEILLSRLESIFKKGYIYDWSVCDWLCTRVLRNLIKVNGMECAKTISKWNTAENVWQARCSVVAFTNINKESQYTHLILQSNAILIQREERFAKTAVGWLLREISKIDQGIVVDFIKKYGQHFSKECLENAIKYFDKKEKILLRRLIIN